MIQSTSCTVSSTKPTPINAMPAYRAPGPNGIDRNSSAAPVRSERPMILPMRGL